MIPKPSQIRPSRRRRMILTPYDPRNLNALLEAQVFSPAVITAAGFVFPDMALFITRKAVK